MLSATVLALAAFAPSTSRTQTPALESFDGTYLLAGDPREGVSQAIDRVVDQMNIFIREIARGELRRRLVPEQRIALSVLDDQTVTLAMDAWGPVGVTLGAGARRMRGATGEDVNLTLRFQGGRLVQHAATSRGGRTNVFTLSPDEQHLHMQVRITSSQLPADIRYVLRYRRAG